MVLDEGLSSHFVRSYILLSIPVLNSVLCSRKELDLTYLVAKADDAKDEIDYAALSAMVRDDPELPGKYSLPIIYGQHILIDLSSCCLMMP